MSECSTGNRPCIICGHDLDTSEPQTCVRCLGRTRRHLLDVEQFYALLPDELDGRAGTAAPLDGGSRGGFEPAMPGGDVLALMAGGSTTTRPSRDGDMSHVADEHGLAPAPLAVLASWEDDWRDVRGDDPGPRATMSGVLGYLTPRLTWAAQHHGAFDEFARELRDLRQAMARALREDDPHDRAAIECPGCGSDLERRYIDADPCPPGCDHTGPGHDQGGMRDEWHCRSRRCGRTVEPAEYWLLVRQRHEEARAC